MTSIVLTGFMGTGKTSVGREVSRRLGLPFVDTDEEIERVTGRTVQQIFEDRGELAFRAVERSIVRDALSRDDAVVATGGGALFADESRALLEARHHVICLTADLATIERRVNGGSGRPLARSAADLRDLMRKRRPVYALFKQVDTTDRPIQDVASEIISGIEHTTTLRIDVEDHRHSDIVIGTGGVAGLPALLRENGLTGQVILVTDTNISSSGIARRVERSLSGAGWRLAIAEIPAGESHKTLETLRRLYDFALEQKTERGDIVVGLGGGVVGDIAGMLAATYLRGLHLVLVPTTLLAQVDAAIGGKVGVDLQGVKNMVGAFYPAELIVVDFSLLATLPAPEIRNGMAEIVKIAAMRSEDLFEQLEEVAGTSNGAWANRDVTRADRDGVTVPTEDDEADPSAATQSFPPRTRTGEGVWGEGSRAALPSVTSSIIRRAAQLKVEVVQQDPRERSVRAYLNYGHTIGHGVEAASRYSIAHGEAVSIGMIAESRLAAREGWASTGTADRIGRMLARFGLSTSTSTLDRTAIREAVGQDKKRAGGQIRIAVPEEIGWGTVRAISDAQLDRGIDFALGDAS